MSLIVVTDTVNNIGTIVIQSYSKINDFHFSISDRYNENKFYTIKRDKNRHYYLQEFINFKPCSKVTRLHKDFIENILNIRIDVF